MKEKKFYGIGIGMGIVTVLLATFMAPVGAILLGCVSLYLNLKKKEICRVKIGIAITILGICNLYGNSISKFSYGLLVI